MGPHQCRGTSSVRVGEATDAPVSGMGQKQKEEGNLTCEHLLVPQLPINKILESEYMYGHFMQHLSSPIMWHALG